MRYITRVKSKQNWTIISKLYDARMLFQSTLPLIVSTTFTAIGLKDACQLLGYSVRSLESGLNKVFPWISSICKITAIFQMYDIVQGLKLRSEINQMLAAITKTDSADRFDFCLRILRITERYRDYLNGWDQRLSIPRLIKVIHTRINRDHANQWEKEKFFRLTKEIAELANSILDLSDRHIRYQAFGLIANVLHSATLIITSPPGTSALLLAASIINTLCEIWKRSKTETGIYEIPQEIAL